MSSTNQNTNTGSGANPKPTKADKKAARANAGVVVGNNNNNNNNSGQSSTDPNVQVKLGAFVDQQKYSVGIPDMDVPTEFSNNDPNHYEAYSQLPKKGSAFASRILGQLEYNNLLSTKVKMEKVTTHTFANFALGMQVTDKSVANIKELLQKASSKGDMEYVYVPTPKNNGGWDVAGPFFFMPEIDDETGVITSEVVIVDGVSFPVAILREYIRVLSNASTVIGNEEFISLLASASFNLDIACARVILRLSENFPPEIWLDVVDKLNLFNLFKGTRVQSNRAIVLDNADPQIKEIMTMILEGLNITKGKGINILSMTKVAAIFPIRVAKMKAAYNPPTLCVESVFKLLKSWKYSEIFMYVGANNLLPNTLQYRLCYAVWSVGYAVASQSETKPLKSWTNKDMNNVLKYALIGFQGTKYSDYKNQIDAMLVDQTPHGGSFSLAGAVDAEIKTIVIALLSKLMKEDGVNPKKSAMKMAIKENPKVIDPEDFLDSFLDASEPDGEISVMEDFFEEKSTNKDDDE